MKKLVLLSLFVSGVAFADIPPWDYSPQKFVSTTLKIQGLKSGSKTENGSTLVLVIDKVGGGRTIEKVINNKAISKGYKFNKARLFFVSAKTLKDAGNNIKKINFPDGESFTANSSESIPILNEIDEPQDQGEIVLAPIEIPSEFWVDENSPVNSKTIIYTVK